MARWARPDTRDGFEVAIICALPVERSMVEALLDEEYEVDNVSYGKAGGDLNSYTTGRVSTQHVVLVYMPGMGLTSATGVAANLRSSFRNIRVAFVVGVCGGAPVSDGGNIFLGDVIISTSVVQVDFGKQYPHKFIRKNEAEDTLGRANPEIRGFLSKMSSPLARKRLIDRTYSFTRCISSHEEFRALSYPGVENDILYPTTHQHKHHKRGCNICGRCLSEDGEVCSLAMRSTCTKLGCKGISLIDRLRAQQRSDILQAGKEAVHRPSVHFGRMASSSQVIKAGSHRDRIINEENVIGFEMESAGTWDYVPTIVVKGVCDYADSHKNKLWQDYAAATAASCTKAMICEWRNSDQPTLEVGCIQRSGLKSQGNFRLQTAPQSPLHFTKEQTDIETAIARLGRIRDIGHVLESYRLSSDEYNHTLHNMEFTQNVLRLQQNITPSLINQLHSRSLLHQTYLIVQESDSFLQKKRGRTMQKASLSSKRGASMIIISPYSSKDVKDVCDRINGHLTAVQLLVSSNLSRLGDESITYENQLVSGIAALVRRTTTSFASQLAAVQFSAMETFYNQLHNFSISVLSSRMSAQSRTTVQLLGWLLVQLNAMFCSIFICIIAYFKTLLLLLPQLLVWSRIVKRLLHGLPAAISLVLHDNIRFEDALGRLHSLQYQQFKHWDVFEENLRKSFRNLPGMKKVAERQFILVGSSQVLSPSNWSDIVQPGTLVTMSMLMSALVFHGKCPRGCDDTTEIQHFGAERCNKCNLIYATFPSQSKRTLRLYALAENSTTESAHKIDIQGGNTMTESSRYIVSKPTPKATPAKIGKVKNLHVSKETQKEKQTALTRTKSNTPAQITESQMFLERVATESEELRAFKRVLFEHEDRDRVLNIREKSKHEEVDVDPKSTENATSQPEAASTADPISKGDRLKGLKRHQHSKQMISCEMCSAEFLLITDFWAHLRSFPSHRHESWVPTGQDERPARPAVFKDVSGRRNSVW